jgi:hypothetical protein
MSVVKAALMMKLMPLTLPHVATDIFCGQMENNTNSKFLSVRALYKAVCYQAGDTDWSQ